MPSELFCRLSDAIFFYLDANAQASYQNSGYIEPDKNMWWSTYLQTVQQDKAVVSFLSYRVFLRKHSDLLPLQTDYIAKHAMGGLYDAISVPYEVVTVSFILQILTARKNQDRRESAQRWLNNASIESISVPTLPCRQCENRSPQVSSGKCSTILNTSI